VRPNPRQAVELRGVLMRGGKALTETWSYVLPRE
jgi:glucan biosynthesis protein